MEVGIWGRGGWGVVGGVGVKGVEGPRGEGDGDKGRGSTEGRLEERLRSGGGTG